MELPAFMTEEEAEDALQVYLNLEGVTEENIWDACNTLYMCKREQGITERLVSHFYKLKHEKMNKLTTTATTPLNNNNNNNNSKAGNVSDSLLLLSPEEWLSLVSSTAQEWKKENNEEDFSVSGAIELFYEPSPPQTIQTARRESSLSNNEMPLPHYLVKPELTNNNNNNNNNNNYTIDNTTTNNSSNNNHKVSNMSNTNRCNNSVSDCSSSTMVSCINNKYISRDSNNSSNKSSSNTNNKNGSLAISRSIINNGNNNNNNNKNVFNYNSKTKTRTLLNLFVSCGARQISVENLQQREWRLTLSQWRKRVEELSLALNCTETPSPIINAISSIICNDNTIMNCDSKEFVMDNILYNNNSNNYNYNNNNSYSGGFITLQRFTAVIKAELATCELCVNNFTRAESQFDFHTANKQTKYKTPLQEQQELQQQENNKQAWTSQCFPSLLQIMRSNTLPCWLCVIANIAERELESLANAEIAHFVRSLICIHSVLVVLLERKSTQIDVLRYAIHEHKQNANQSSQMKYSNSKNNNNNISNKKELNNSKALPHANSYSNCESSSSLESLMHKTQSSYLRSKELQEAKHIKARYMESKPLDEVSQSIVARTRARRLLEALRKNTIPINRFEGFAQLEADEPTDFAQNLLEEWEQSAKTNKKKQHHHQQHNHKHTHHKEQRESHNRKEQKNEITKSIKNNNNNNVKNTGCNKRTQIHCNRCSSLETELNNDASVHKPYHTTKSPNPSYTRPEATSLPQSTEFYISPSRNSSPASSFSSSSSSLETESSYDSDAMLPAQILFSRPPLYNNMSMTRKESHYNNISLQQSTLAKHYKNMPHSLLCPRRAVPQSVMFKVNASVPTSHYYSNLKTNRNNKLENKKDGVSTFERLSKPNVDVRWFQSAKTKSYSRPADDNINTGVEYGGNCNDREYNSLYDKTSERLQSQETTRPQSALADFARSSHRIHHKQPAEKFLASTTTASEAQSQSELLLFPCEPTKSEPTEVVHETSSKATRHMSQQCKSCIANPITTTISSSRMKNKATDTTKRHTSQKKPLMEEYLEKVETELRQHNVLNIQLLLNELRNEPQGKFISNSNSSNIFVKAEKKCNKNNKVNKKLEVETQISDQNTRGRRKRKKQTTATTADKTTIPATATTKPSYSTRSRNKIKSISQIYGVAN